MTSKKWIILTALVMALALPFTSLATESFGAGNLVEGKTYTVEEMLTYAIQDEYLARAEYEAIIQKFGVDRPFSNIMQAEVTHAELIMPLLTKYGITLPEDTSSQHVVLPDTLDEIYEIGITAEVTNIGMYDTFLKQDDLPDDVRDLFEKLKRASENHLRAFQRNADRQGEGRRRGK